MSLGYFPEAEVSRAMRKVAVDSLKSQLPGAIRMEYKKVFDRHGKPIDEAEAAFKRGAKANGEELEKNGLVGAAGKAARESLGRIANKPRPYFSEGVNSIRGGEFVRGLGPVFGIPSRG